MDSPTKETLKIDLQTALKHNQFILYYQPIFNLVTSRFDAIEALIRWQHPTYGMLLPEEFIHIAEESGLIVRIGEWVLKAACAQCKAWQDQGLPPIRMAVNIAGRQFHQKEFVEMIMRVLADTRLKPKYLEIELSENMILHEESAVIKQIQRIKNLGISIALDDFGTGYSSVTYLKTIPVDRIKIDKVFIQDAYRDKQSATIVQAMITLAQGLNVEVVAEGVETLAQLQPLLAQHCHEIQGFYFSKPLPASEVEKFLSRIKIHLVGFASGLGGVDPRSGDGPAILQRSPYMMPLSQNGATYTWDTVFQSPAASDSLRIDEAVREVCLALANRISAFTRDHQWFGVIGGDHTAAIGTWSGVYDALHQKGDIGLIWIDAHMDSHTPETTESGRIHGMPLACLLGYGYPTLTTILNDQPKLKPENVCLIGVRSFESGEAALLKRLNVRVYLMDEVKQRGFQTVLREAADIVSQRTLAYGISIDLDGIDPLDAPGVGVPVPDGIKENDLYEGLKAVAADAKLIGTEMVEFDPARDVDHKTEILMTNILEILSRARQS